MKHKAERVVPKADRVASAVVAVVGLSVVMMFGLLYALTPPTAVMVEHQISMNRE